MMCVGAVGKRTGKETNLLNSEAVAAASDSPLLRGLACMVSICQYTMVPNELFLFHYLERLRRISKG